MPAFTLIHSLREEGGVAEKVTASSFGAAWPREGGLKPCSHTTLAGTSLFQPYKAKSPEQQVGMDAEKKTVKPHFTKYT